MNDERTDLDLELRQALDVTPSPEFVARVRARIASEPERSAWRLHWGFAVAGAGTLAIVAALAILRLHEQLPPRAADVVLPTTAIVDAKADPDVSVDRPGSGAVHRFRPSASRPAVSPVARDRAALVVSRAEMRGLRRLIALANQGDPGLELLLAPPSDPTPILAIEPVEIVIAPITIAPLAPDTY